MSKLKEKIEGILEAGDMFLNPPEDMAEFIEKGAIKQSRADQILTAFKAHIEGFKSPTLELALDDTNTYIIMLQGERFRAGVESLRKALMESLE